MNKIIGYISIFIIFYLQISIFNPRVVNAQETLIDPPTTNLIIPESNGSLSGTLDTTNTNTGIVSNSGSILPEIQPPTETQPTETQPTETQPIEIETYFVVSAYYSPLPNQQHYLKGNYEDEVTLNGRGLRGASGKDVFSGMLAGPKSYNFGTKIYLEGLGIGEISDRGGAIVSASGSESRGYAYDRIDVWVGSGEEGLKRALAWGKRTVKGKIILDNTTPVSLDVSKLPAPDSVVKNLVYKPHKEKDQTPNILSKNITPQSGTGDIQELQALFLDMGMYNSGVIDGKYSSIVGPLINYQIKIGIVKKATDDGAGYFGPKTRTKLKEEYILMLQSRKKLALEKKKLENELAQIKQKVKINVEKHVASIGSPKIGDVGENVRNLQKTLKSLGYFQVKDSAIYGIKTQTSLIKYQLDKGIIKSQNEEGAGVFGPKTKEAIQSELIGVFEQKIFAQKNLLSYVNKK